MTRNIEQLRSLQKRIREAKEADRELDAEICVALRYGPHPILHSFAFKLPSWSARIDGRVNVLNEDGSVSGHFGTPEFTLDPDGLGPCVALQRAVLPGWKWDVFQRHISEKDEQFSVWLSAPNGDHAQAYHRFEPRARLLVIVGALIAQESGVENAS